MNHPDIETLTQFALDDPLALDASTLVHISDCDECSAEIAQIQRVVDATLVVGGRPDLRMQTPPPLQVWDRIVAGLEADAPVTSLATPEVGLHRGEPIEQGWLFGPTGDADSAAATTTYVEPPPRPSTAWRLIAAAVVGLILGAGVTWVIVGGPESSGSSTGPSVATSTLEGIDGHTTSGRLALQDTPAGPRLTVDFDPGTTGDKFVQVWLLDAQTGGMLSLGVLDGTTGSYAIPSNVDLTAYSEVDVSLEPFDGNPQHSRTSLARGPVPTA